MIVKVIYEPFVNYEIYTNVEKVERKITEDCEILVITTNKEENSNIIKISKIDEKGNRPSLISSAYLMNIDGKTIERLV